MKCAIMQPTYLPWIGYFDLIRDTDVFVIFDHVQFEKRSWQQKNRIRGKEGELLLSVPVSTKGKFFQPVNEVQIDLTQKHTAKHLNSIKMNYAKAKNFADVFGELETLMNKNHEKLIDLNIALIQMGCRRLGIREEFVFSSSLDVEGAKVEALVDICKKQNCNEYLSPVGSKGYIDENNIFPANNIALYYQGFQHPVYQQINYPDFISHLSFIDYLFNTTADEASLFGQKN